jgi:phosphotransacetylase
MHNELAPKNKKLVEQALKINKPFVVGVVNPTDGESLAGALTAAKENLITPIFLGPKDKIAKAAQSFGADISKYECVDIADAHDAARQAVQMVHDKKIHAIMKGTIHTAELMRIVIARESNLRTERRISHCLTVDVPTYEKIMIFTDVAVNILPDVSTKVDILKNAIEFANSIGIDMPRIAVLAAVESVTENNPATIDAALLCKMAERGQIGKCKIDGPLSIDLAVSEQAAKDKNFTPVLDEKPDIFLAPDLNSGNIGIKILDYFANGQSAGIIVGAKIPLIVMRRSSPATEHLVSCALAKMYSNKQ